MGTLIIDNWKVIAGIFGSLIFMGLLWYGIWKLQQAERLKYELADQEVIRKYEEKLKRQQDQIRTDHANYRKTLPRP